MIDRPPRRIMIVPSARPVDAGAASEPIRRYKLARAMQVVESGDRFDYLKRMHD